MQSPTSSPYLTATLTSPHSILDFSGNQPFTFLITLTLHDAPSPIVTYTQVYDTFFLPRSALTDVGIIFSDHKTKEEIRICHIDSSGSPGYARRLTDESKLLLRPEEAVVFEVPFDILSEKDEDAETGFDPWMASLSSVFKDGGVYEAELPLYRTLDWWRYAKSSELGKDDKDDSTAMDTVEIAVESVVDEKSDVEVRYGVPVLAYDRQLPVYIEGDGVVFSCIGKAMEWPAGLLEKQKINKQRRDGEERRKAEEKRREREKAK